MRWVPIVVAVASLGVLAGCNKGGSGGGFSGRASAGKENVFRYPIETLTKLDPAMVQDGDSIDVLQQVYEGLTTWGEDNKVTPNLAESWDISPDGRTYTFHIRKGVKFHNGREVKADDFKYTLERVADPALKSPTVLTYLGDIVGVKEKVAGKATELSGVKVVDEYTLAVTIDKARPYFLGRLTYPASFVVAKEVAPMGKEIMDVASMVGTGPFKAERFEPDQIMILAANKEYRTGSPLVDKIERPTFKDGLTRLNKFKSGEVDLTRVERADISGIQEDAELKDLLHLYDRPSMYYMGMNVNIKPFDNKLVRQAFAMAVDRDAICSGVLGGINKPARAIVPPGIEAHRDDAPAFPFNPAKAKQLLAQAGYPDGKGFPAVEMSHRDGQPDVKLVAEMLVTQLRQNLGIKATTKMIPWTTYLEKHNAKQLPLFHMRWGADYLDAENYLSTLLASYGNENKVGYANPTYDKLCSTADSMVGNEAERVRLYKQAEDIALDDAPFVPIYYEKYAELQSKRLSGLRDSVFGHLPHTKVTLK
ncbi:MAG: ABC transporter substrate-binding protein [Fimbriimonas sp.]